MKLLRTMFVVFAALMICASAANAGVISYSTTVPSTAMRVDWNSGWLPTPPGLQQFDQSTGNVLTGITIELSATVGPGSITMKNLGSMATELGLTDTLTLSVITPLVSSPNPTVVVNGPSLTWTAYQAVVNPGETVVTDFGMPAGITVSNTQTFTNPALFAPFIGNGSVSGINIIGHGQVTDIKGGGNISFETNAPAQATMTVTYTYGVPEPATFVLLGAGLVVVTAIGRKRLAKR